MLLFILLFLKDKQSEGKKKKRGRKLKKHMSKVMPCKMQKAGGILEHQF